MTSIQSDQRDKHIKRLISIQSDLDAERAKIDHGPAVLMNHEGTVANRTIARKLREANDLIAEATYLLNTAKIS